MNELEIFSYLKSKGYNNNAVCAIMGNLKQESNLSPINLQSNGNKKLGLSDKQYTKLVDNGEYDNFKRDSYGYGLVQWTFWSRKQSLLAYCQHKGTSIGDLEMQLEFMCKELRQYSAVHTALMSSNSTLRDCTEVVLKKYEKPADQSEKALQRRLGYAQEYYNQFVPYFDKAVEVLNGVWGNGEVRKKRLGKLYGKTQKIVNELVKRGRENGNFINRNIDRLNKS